MSEIKNYAKVRPAWLRWLFSSPVVAVISHWVFQSYFYMDWGERIFKTCLDTGLALISFLILKQWLNLWISGAFAILLAHTINFIFNAHLWGALKHYGMVQKTYEEYQRYLELLEVRVKMENSLQEHFLIGSLLGSRWMPHSDIDIRLVRKAGWANWFRACLFVMLERSRAIFAHFPLDIYVFDHSADRIKAIKESRLVDKEEVQSNARKKIIN